MHVNYVPGPIHETLSQQKSIRIPVQEDGLVNKPCSGLYHTPNWFVDSAPARAGHLARHRR